MSFLGKIGNKLARYFSQSREQDHRVATSKPEQLVAALQPGDVLLVEGSSRFSAAIKYLTQSTWSHAAIYISAETNLDGLHFEGGQLLEADVVEGVHIVPLSTYWTMHTRICRPVGLSPNEIEAVLLHAKSQIGHQYDLKNIVDLARYFFPTPPVPARWRRRLLSIGSGDPTKAICSSVIAQAFQSVRYPILPEAVVAKSTDSASADSYREMLHIRHHSLFAPRDFDISPYFRIVKPTIEDGFDPHNLEWVDTANK
ncbi:MAG: YiiX/YebB-like N1pC/P60 family cysteine hydrolase [Calditrichia bacterium]